jgi:tetratricopeptide (TPR) repeat protein
MLHLTNFLLRMKRGVEAIELVEKWHSKLKPAEACELLVSAAAVSERYGLGKEEKFLRLAVEYDPDSEKAAQHLGKLLEALGKNGDAQALRDRSAMPVTFEDLRARARRALDERRAEAALSACEAALAIDPKSLDMLMTRAGALELLASPAGVEASLLRAKEIDPVRSAVALSLFYLRNERFADAAAIADGVLK